MNLTGRPPCPKGLKRTSRGKAKPPSASDRRYWDRLCALGCIVGPVGCRGRITIHHCGTGAGGRKDHRKVIPLCFNHHQGDEGIDAKHNGSPQSKRAWMKKHGTEEELINRVRLELKMEDL